MSNTKKIASIAFTGAAATAATLMGVTPAFAASPYNIRKSGVTGPLYHGVVKAKNSGATILKDTTKGTTLTCAHAFASGSISNGKSHGTTPAVVGHLKKTTTKWSSCTGPFGLAFKAHLTTSPRISLVTASAGGGTGKLITPAAGGKISGKISGTGLAGLCHATISGTMVPVKYVNAGNKFKVNSTSSVTLKVKSAANCLGAISAGDSAFFKGTYKVSTPANMVMRL